MRILRIAKWGFTGLLGLLLLGWALSSGGEHAVGQGRSVEVADGYLTIRLWTGERAAPGMPADAAPEGGIPDTRNIPMWIALLVLAVPTAALWLWDRRVVSDRVSLRGARTG